MYMEVSPNLIALGNSGQRPPHVWTAAEDRKLKRMAAAGCSRQDMSATLGLTVAQIANRLNYTRTNIARRPPAKTNNALVDEVRARAFEMHISIVDLDRSLGNQRIFTNSTCHQVAAKHIHRAVKALGGEVKIEWAEH